MKPIAVSELGFVKHEGFFGIVVGLSEDIDGYIKYRYGDLGWGISLSELHTDMAERLKVVLPYFSINYIEWPLIEGVTIEDNSVAIDTSCWAYTIGNNEISWEKYRLIYPEEDHEEDSS